MHRLVSITVALVFAGNAFAVTPQFWRIRTADDFLSGEIEGFAVTSRGQLKSAPSVRKTATFTDPFVLSQTVAPNGEQFFGTGNDGKVYRLRNGELKLLYTAPEPEIYAVAYRDGYVYAGTSPNGKIYRIDVGNGKATEFFDPKQAYIWALRFAGNDLYAATGVEGKLFRVNASGSGKIWFDSPETHLRTVAIRPNGSLLVGSSGKGRIYSVGGENSAHALYESALNEISSIYVDGNGVGWAAGVSNVLPSSAPAKSQQQQQRSQQQQQQSSSSSSSQSEQKKEESTANVEVSFSFDDGSPSTPQAGAGELYRINTDDFVEVVRRFEREMIYALDAGRDGSVLLSTGPTGRIYEFRDGEAALIATVPEKQVVSVAQANGATFVTTTNSGAVYRLDSAPFAAAEFRSAVKDVERFSRFGQYRMEGTGIDRGTVAIAFRSGNTKTPDATWSAWSTPSTTAEGNITSPPGRYIQWKLSMAKPSNDLTVETVTLAFVNRNVAPSIDSVAVQDPAVVYISSGYPASPQVVEATNPDEYGIFSSLEPARQGGEQGKRVFRKGYRTITWRARDENGDTLRYSVAFRPRGTERWLRLRDNIEETQVNFDTSQLPDGTYQLRVTATDALENPDMPMSDIKDGIEFQVDNTAPAVASSNDGDELVVKVSDKLSPVGKVEYSADAQKWIRITPVDGISDSTSETFRIPRSAVAGKFVIVRAVDAFFNVTTESVAVSGAPQAVSR